MLKKEKEKILLKTKTGKEEIISEFTISLWVNLVGVKKCFLFNLRLVFLLVVQIQLDHG